jgi:hypothetical protein
MPTGSDEIIRELRTVLIDCAALLRHYVDKRQSNWDGSTEGQARSCIRDARAILEKTKEVA